MDLEVGKQAAGCIPGQRYPKQPLDIPAVAAHKKHIGCHPPHIQVLASLHPLQSTQHQHVTSFPSLTSMARRWRLRRSKGGIATHVHSLFLSMEAIDRIFSCSCFTRDASRHLCHADEFLLCQFWKPLKVCPADLLRT